MGLSKAEPKALLEESARAGTRDHLICCLLLYNGLRVSEVTGARIENLRRDRGHHVLWVRRKGGADGLIALAGPTWRAIQAHLAERGNPGRPAHRTQAQLGTDASAVQRVLNQLRVRAGIAAHLHPHALRHTFDTLALAAGVELHHVQDGAGHADPATTQRYNRARHSLDHHATYRLAEYLAGGGLDPRGGRAKEGGR